MVVLGIMGVQGPEEQMLDAQLQAIVSRRAIFEDEIEPGPLLAVSKDEVEFRDAITGQPLEAALVRAARREELEYFAAKTVWRKVPRAEAMQKQGKPPISVKWVDVNKGDDESPNYRSRLVAREVRRPWEDSIFSPTPPLEALRSVLSRAATDFKGHAPHVRDPNSKERTQISFIDIRRAYFNAWVSEA